MRKMIGRENSTKQHFSIYNTVSMNKKKSKKYQNRSHRLTCDEPAPLVSARDVTSGIDPTPTGAHAPNQAL